MIEILQEITDWGEDKVSNKTQIGFKRPLFFSKSRRKFKKL